VKPSLANLRKKAAALAERIPLGRFHPQVLSFFQRVEEGLSCDDGSATEARRTASGALATRAGAPVAARAGALDASEPSPSVLRLSVVALSGGADSVALLLLLWAHFPERRGDFVALHYNHRLRGAEADADEAFCCELCERLGVELAVGRRPDGVELRSEAEAREARFVFFSDELARRSARLLWLGHQQNDVAETLLMRLVRGSGTGGLAAPRPVQKIASSESDRERIHLRPLLTLSRVEIEAALRDCGIPWREDATNAGGEFFRNRIRRDVLPALVAASEPSRAAEGECTKTECRKSEGRDVLAGMALSRELLDEDDAALDAWADNVAKTVIREGEINLRGLASAPRAVRRRVLYRWLRAHAGAPQISRQAFEALLSAVESGQSTRQSLGKTGFALIRRKHLRFEAA